MLADDRYTAAVDGRTGPPDFNLRRTAAEWQGRAGDTAGAAVVYRQLLDEQFRTYGPEHPRTFDTRFRFGHWLGESGDVRGAVTVLSDLLSEQLRVLRPDHPDLATTRQALTYWQERSGGRGWLRRR
jgi:hypothetical protein